MKLNNGNVNTAVDELGINHNSELFQDNDILTNLDANSQDSKKPNIWVSGQHEMQALSTLSSVASIRRYNERELGTGHHYFIDDGNTPEWAIKAKGYENPGQCWVHSINQPLEYCISDAVAAHEFWMQCLDYALSFDDWCATKDRKNLTIKEAVELANIAFKHLRGSQLTTELDTLRVRCGQNDYTWNKRMASLEREFRELLQNRGLTTDNPAERLKLEVKRYLAEKDEAVKALIAKELVKQGIGYRAIQAIAAQLDNSFNTPKAKVYTSYDLVNYEPDVAPFLIPGIIPSTGVAIVGGEPGTGKSTLAYDLGFAVMTGSDFLGETPSRTGKVLILAGDEPFNQMHSKIKTRKYISDCLGMFEIVHDWDISQDAILEEKLEDLKPALVIIDSFSSINQNDPNFDENLPTAAKCVRKLNRLFERYNCAALMIHHANKNKEQKRTNKLRGNSGIAAAATAVLLLEATADINTQKLLAPKVRGGASFEYLISIDYAETGKASIIGCQEEIKKAKSTKEAIKNLFEQIVHGTKLEFVEIKHHVGGSDANLRKSLQRLCDEGVLVWDYSKVNHATKVWRLNSRYKISNPPLPTESVILSNDFNQPVTVQESQTLDTTLDKQWTNSGQPIGQDTQNSPCPITENYTGQCFGQPVDNIPINEEGGGVVQSSGQVAQSTTTDSVSIQDLQPGDKVESEELHLVNGWGKVSRIDGDMVHIEYFARPIAKTSITSINNRPVRGEYGR